MTGYGLCTTFRQTSALTSICRPRLSHILDTLLLLLSSGLKQLSNLNSCSTICIPTYVYTSLCTSMDDSTKSPPVTGTSSVALRCVEATSIWFLNASIGPRWGISMLSRCRPIVYVADDRALGSTLLVFGPSQVELHCFTYVAQQCPCQLSIPQGFAMGDVWRSSES
jgi:hypothetical protein